MFQSKVGYRLLQSSVIIESEHPEQPVLETLIGLVFGRVPDELEDLNGNILGHSLNATIKLGLTFNYSLELELRLWLNNLHLDVVRPEWGQLHPDSFEEVSSGERGGNSLEDDWISRHTNS